MKTWLLAILFVHALALGCVQAAESTQRVLTYHAGGERRGNFIVPALNWERARSLRLDPRFHARIAGHVYAQPLYWQDSTQPGMLLVATESASVYALDGATGQVIWQRALGKPVPRVLLPCGNIDPLGVTGTPVIDPGTHAIYLDAMLLDAQSNVPEHEIFALSLKDGSTLPGWPVKVAARLAAQGLDFVARDQNQRAALAILGDTVYVPYGGHFGDCARYHGWVVGVKVADPRALTAWRTAARGGGVWAQAGISSDGRSLFVATGNTMSTTNWGGGEAVIRLNSALAFSGMPADFFAPADWRQLDAKDADLGGVAPVLFELGGKAFAVALGKDGKAYLLDRRDLGGIGGALAVMRASPDAIRGAAAAVPAADGVLIAFQGRGSDCPAARAGTGLTVLRLQAGAPPTLGTAWCSSVRGHGAPIVTTTDGRASPIVWALGAEGDDRLYAFRGDTGERLFMSAPMQGLRHFQTLIATRNRLYVAADDNVFAFAF